VPRVAIIMPVYNGAPFLRESIGSVLDQRFRDFELVAVDDGSTDRSWEILQSFEHDRRVKPVRREKNQGPAAARNEGIARSDSEFIALLDADDLAKPRRLQVQVQALECHRHFDFVFGRAEVISNGRLQMTRRGPSSYAEVAPTLLFRNCIVQSSVMARRRWWQPYDVAFELAEDYELWTRLSQSHSFFPLDSALVTYREHSGGISKRLSDKMVRAVAAIHRLQLKCLGVADRVDLHTRLTAWPWDSDVRQLGEAEKWLLELLAANRVYPRASLRSVIEKIWFEICRDSLAVGPAAFTIYRRSTLSRLTPSCLWSFARRFGRRALLG
jgi:glycosyltransferase involved in cell wall biosynthesis